MTFFFDRNIAPRLARMVAGFEHGTKNSILHLDLDPRFDRKDSDTLILNKLSGADPKPVFLTVDLNMFYRNHHERQALKDSGLTCFFFVETFLNLEFPIQAWKLMRLWPEIVAQSRHCTRPTAFEIRPRSTEVQYVCLTSEIC